MSSLFSVDSGRRKINSLIHILSFLPLPMKNTFSARAGGMWAGRRSGRSLNAPPLLRLWSAPGRRMRLSSAALSSRVMKNSWYNWQNLHKFCNGKKSFFYD
jgi:hypothetical protein